jgi:hypothetical protein
MSEDPVQRTEFNAAMEGIRTELSRLGRSQELMAADTSKSLTNLFELHRQCGQRREMKAFSEGVEVGRVNTLFEEVSELKTDKRANTLFRRTIMTGTSVALISSLIAIVVSYINRAPK